MPDISEKPTSTTVRLEDPLSTKNDLKSCEFEAAISASGYGKFNFYVILVALSTGIVCVFEVRLMAYVVPAAQCDLHLEIKNKAALTAIPSAGMVLTSFIWGFLGDTFGRRKLLVCICFVGFLFMVLAGLSQSFEILLTARLFGGIISSGIVPNLLSYLTEVHSAKYRAFMQLLVGSIYGIGDFLLAMLALIFLTNPTDIQIFEIVVLRPWNIYLLALSIPSLLSSICFLFLPESPRFLMSKQRNEKAMNVFQKIYSINSNNPKEEYPVKSLKKNEVNADSQFGSTGANFTKSCLFQCSPFLEKSNLTNILLSVSVQFLMFMCTNSVLLWLPQILQEMNNHQISHNDTATMCETLSDLNIKTNRVGEICTEDMDKNRRIYVYLMMIATTTMLVFVLSCFVVQYAGKKKLLYIIGICSATATLLLIYARDFLVTIVLTSVICGFGNVSFSALVAIVSDLFPTNLRAMSVSLTMMMGRLGGVLGVFIFPLFLNYGCEPALLLVSCFTLTWVLLVSVLPHSEPTTLK